MRVQMRLCPRGRMRACVRARLCACSRACVRARVLARAGHIPVILDKGRGIGGRLATRRASDGLRFDHGAQYLTARSDGFRALIAETCKAGATDLWDDGSGRDHFVGAPGMSALAKQLAEGLDVRLKTEVTGVSAGKDGWSLHVGPKTLLFRHLVGAWGQPSSTPPTPSNATVV